jgi:hypothetical protein
MEDASPTTPDDPITSSCEETVQSKPWPAVVRLGQLIVAELGRPARTSLLARWMAHALAELLERAQQAEDGIARDTARRECMELVLRLWNLRAEWPNGGPLERMLTCLRDIVEADKSNTGPPRHGASLLEVFADLARREQLLFVQAALADEPVEEPEAWLEHGDELSEIERSFLEFAMKMRDEMQSDQFRLDVVPAPKFATLPQAQRQLLFQQALKAIADERSDALASITGEKLAQEAEAQREP